MVGQCTNRRRVHYPSETITTLPECTITNLIMHKNLYMNYLVLLTYPKRPLLLKFVKCALHDLKYSQVIDSEESDSLRVT